MAFTNAQLLNVPFQRVLSRMTAAELKTVLLAQGLLTGSGDDPPSEMTAEGAISFYDYNNGEGSYYETSPAYRYSGGRFPSNQRGLQIRASLASAYSTNPASFLRGFSDARVTQLTRIAHFDAGSAGADTPIVIWDEARLSGVTPPESGNICLPLTMLYSSGNANYTGATAATALALKSAGRRAIKMGGYAGNFAAFWSIPTNSAATNNSWRQCFFNRDFDTFHAHGVLCDTWHAAMTDANSTWRKFWEDLRSNGGADIVDHLILDVNEVVQPRFWKRQSTAGPSPAIEVAPVSVSIDTGSDILTAVGHTLETGQPFKFHTSTGTLPQISGGDVSTSQPYYVRRIDADTFYLHLTPGAALAAGTPRNFTNAGSSVKYLSYAETLANWFLDTADWETARTTILKPVLSQAIWNDYSDWSVQTDERVALFDVAYEKYVADKWADVLQIALDEFPNLQIADYAATLRCPATRSTLSMPAFGHFPYGAGQKIGNLSSHSQYMIYDATVYKWSVPGTVTQSLSNPSAALTWATLVQGVAALRSTFAADPDHCEVWIAPTAGGLSIPEDDAMASEYLLHMLLPSVSRIGFYNSYANNDLPTIAQQTLALNLIAERDAIVAYTPATLDPEDDLNADYTRTYLTTRVWAGGRWVWRITFKPGTSYSITQIGDGVRVSPQGAAAFFIPHAQIVHRVGTYGSLGYWITQLTRGSDGYPVAD